MTEKIWKFWNDDIDGKFDTYEEYEKNSFKSILEEYGEALKVDMNNLLDYRIITDITSLTDGIDGHNDSKTTLYCIVPIKNYNVRFFEIDFNSLKRYPCNFHNNLSKNYHICNCKDELMLTIEKEIKHKDTMSAICNLLYHFYKKEDIEKIRNSD